MMSSAVPHIDEWVVLVADDGTPIGRAAKAEVHTEDTPLHLAFSCYVFNADGQVLVTRRALSKRTWPGVWTNSFCGHPAPEESFADAIARRAQFELGLDVTDVELVLPEFRYRAVDASGVVEHEICPVFIARAASHPQPNADEVVEWAWVSFDALAHTAAHLPQLVSPWLVDQVTQLAPLLRISTPS